MKNESSDANPDWLMLVLTIPGHQPALRMRVWRKLKASGVGVLRDGVYVAPDNANLRSMLAAQAEELIGAGGTAQLLSINGQRDDFSALFDRADEYRELLKRVTAIAKSVAKASGSKLGTQADSLRREFEAIVTRDFFPGAPQRQSREALDDLTARITRKLTPDEPHAARGRLIKHDRAQFQRRTWATRSRPWVDRLASAWLIRRFIDPKGRIVWLQDVRQKPAKAIGFDFDGADFSHADDKVTFESLLHAFSLDDDAALLQIAAVVHYLDVGGVPAAEAPAIETILRGMRQRAADDDALFVHASRLFDDLYAGFEHAQT